MRTRKDGRLRRSREEWEEIISLFEQSGLSENRFCQEQGLQRKTFRTWRQRLEQGFDKKASMPSAFIELPVPNTAAPLIESALDVGSFELALPGGVTLRWRT